MAASTPSCVAREHLIARAQIAHGNFQVEVNSFRRIKQRDENDSLCSDLEFSVNGGPTGRFNHESKNVQTITTSLVWKFH
jgi:hypothetical protein